MHVGPATADQRLLVLGWCRCSLWSFRSPAFSLHTVFHICMLMNYQGVASSSSPVLRVSPAGLVSYFLLV